MRSPLIILQQERKKAPVNPSGPGALSGAVWLIAASASSSVKGASRWDRSKVWRLSAFQSKSRSRGHGHQIGKMELSQSCFVLMGSRPARAILEAKNVIPTSTPICFQVEVLSVGVTLSQVFDPGSLLFPRTLDHRVTQHPTLEPLS